MRTVRLNGGRVDNSLIAAVSQMLIELDIWQWA